MIGSDLFGDGLFGDDAASAPPPPPPAFATLPGAVRAFLLASLPGLTGVYRRQAPARPPAFPYCVYNPIGETPGWNTGGSSYPADLTLQLTFLDATDAGAEALRDAAYLLFSPSKSGGVPAPNVATFADGSLPPCGSLPGRKTEIRQPNRGPGGTAVWAFAFDVTFYVTRWM